MIALILATKNDVPSDHSRATLIGELIACFWYLMKINSLIYSRSSFCNVKLGGTDQGTLCV